MQELVGAAFRKEGSNFLPPQLEYMLTNVDGNGESLAQQARATMTEVMKTGRAGLLVDMPEGTTNLSDMQQGLSLIHISEPTRPY